MPKLVITYEIARAIGEDAGDSAMRSAGRTAWSEDDYNAAVEAFNTAYPLEVHLANMLVAPNKQWDQAEVMQ
jgi:hypothetical protein